MLKFFTGCLAAVLVVESAYIVLHRQTANRFKPVEGYEGIVAFDTATGQLCKTLRTKSPAEIESSDPKAPIPTPPCPPLPTPSGDPVLDEIGRLGISKGCGGDGEESWEKASSDATLQFIANLPGCMNIR
jgi:hypothetical protein